MRPRFKTFTEQTCALSAAETLLHKSPRPKEATPAQSWLLDCFCLCGRLHVLHDILQPVQPQHQLLYDVLLLAVFLRQSLHAQVKHGIVITMIVLMVESLSGLLKTV